MKIDNDFRGHPAFAGFSEVIPLSGMSGARVAVLRTSAGSRFVRKASSDATSGQVLRRQAQRQSWLRAAVAGSANVPEIITDGAADGYYYFDMPFIASRDAVSLLSTATFEEVRDFAERIVKLMQCLARTGAEPGARRPPSKQALVEKLDEITLRTHEGFSSVLAPLRRAALEIDALRSVDNSGPTAVHGDLTFENILVTSKGQLWLIDTIESPFDHYWIDWSKLFQECEGRWHAQRGRPISTSVTWWLRNHWLEAASRLASDYPKRHYLLLGLTFARILPYAVSESDRKYLIEKISAFGKFALTTTS
jgi:aminoglycoside phosphotransferase (APT) family kinase protein